MEERDLSDIKRANSFKCPTCNAKTPEYQGGGYELEGEIYPQFYNEYKSSTMNGNIHDWDEVWRCKSCGTEYWFLNGAY